MSKKKAKKKSKKTETSPPETPPEAETASPEPGEAPSAPIQHSDPRPEIIHPRASVPGGETPEFLKVPDQLRRAVQDQQDNVKPSPPESDKQLITPTEEPGAAHEKLRAAQSRFIADIMAVARGLGSEGGEALRSHLASLAPDELFPFGGSLEAPVSASPLGDEANDLGNDPGVAILMVRSALSEPGIDTRDFILSSVVPTLRRWIREGRHTPEQHVDLLAMTIMGRVRACTPGLRKTLAALAGHLIRQQDKSHHEFWGTVGVLADHLRDLGGPCRLQAIAYYQEVVLAGLRLCYAASPNADDYLYRLGRLTGNANSLAVTLSNHADEIGNSGAGLAPVFRALLPLRLYGIDLDDAVITNEEGVKQVNRAALDAPEWDDEDFILWSKRLRFLMAAPPTVAYFLGDELRQGFLSAVCGAQSLWYEEPRQWDRAVSSFFNASASLARFGSRHSGELNHELPQALVAGLGLLVAVRAWSEEKVVGSPDWLIQFHGLSAAVNLFGALSSAGLLKKEKEWKMRGRRLVAGLLACLPQNAIPLEYERIRGAFGEALPRAQQLDDHTMVDVVVEHLEHIVARMTTSKDKDSSSASPAVDWPGPEGLREPKSIGTLIRQTFDWAFEEQQFGKIVKELETKVLEELPHRARTERPPSDYRDDICPVGVMEAASTPEGALSANDAPPGFPGPLVRGKLLPDDQWAEVLGRAFSLNVNVADEIARNLDWI